MVNRFVTTLVLAGLFGLLLESDASATQIVCSVQDAVECSSDGYCGPPDFGATVPVTFFLIDTDQKRITLLAPDERRGETTDIHSEVETEDGWLFAGVENERSWSIYVSRGGDVTLSITMDRAIWSGFGRWMPAENVKP